MGDLRKRLTEGDPAAREPGMSDGDVQAMRRTVLAEARVQPEPAASWPRALPLAAALAACLMVGIGIGVRVRLSDDAVAPSVTPRLVTPVRDFGRQLQMTSPGGTRIIWTFHQELSL
jgi:hypothetical protein